MWNLQISQDFDALSITNYISKDKNKCLDFLLNDLFSRNLTHEEFEQKLKDEKSRESYHFIIRAFEDDGSLKYEKDMGYSEREYYTRDFENIDSFDTLIEHLNDGKKVRLEYFTVRLYKLRTHFHAFKAEYNGDEHRIRLDNTDVFLESGHPALYDCCTYEIGRGEVLIGKLTHGEEEDLDELKRDLIRSGLFDYSIEPELHEINELEFFKNEYFYTTYNLDNVLMI